VLFADVRGYTSLTERLSAPEVPALVNRFYTAASDALLKRGGLLAQIAGDQVMALFVPGFAGDQYRAHGIEAGLGILHAVGYGYADAEPWLQVGVGIASGEQFVGNVGGGGYKDFTSVGDVTNTAARLTASAAGGELLVDEATYEAVAAAVPDAERRVLELKGKAQPVPAYAISAETPLTHA
jgi:adenylate cyclase